MKGREFTVMVQHNQALANSKAGIGTDYRSRRAFAAEMAHEHDDNTGPAKPLNVASLHPLGDFLHLSLIHI